MSEQKPDKPSNVKVFSYNSDVIHTKPELEDKLEKLGQQEDSHSDADGE